MATEQKIKDIGTLIVAALVYAFNDKSAEAALAEAKHFIEKAEIAMPGIFDVDLDGDKEP